MAVRKIRDTWWVDFQIGRTRYRKRSPRNSRDDAKAFEALLRSRLSRGEPLIPAKTAASPLFQDFAAQWLNDYVKANNKESEQYNKEIYLRVHLVPFFGSKRLDEITPEQIEKYKAKKRSEKLSDVTINIHLTSLARCLRIAQEWGKLKDFPKLVKIKTSQSPVDFLQPNDSEVLLEHTRVNEPHWYEMILVALRTGMRRGELIALQWPDVDFIRRKITVRSSMGRFTIGSTKSNRIRHVPMTPEVLSVLAAKQRQKGFVFTSSSGGAVARNTMHQNLKRIGGQLGLGELHWHMFRHSFASHLVGAGVPLNVVKELMGHSDIKMTMRYAHFAPSMYDKAVDVLDSLGKSAEANECQPGVNTPLLGLPSG